MKHYEEIASIVVNKMNKGDREEYEMITEKYNKHFRVISLLSYVCLHKERYSLKECGLIYSSVMRFLGPFLSQDDYKTVKRTKAIYGYKLALNRVDEFYYSNFYEPLKK